MARKLLGLFALFAVLTVGFVAVRALSAQGHGGMMGMMSMMKDCPMMGAMTHGPEAALRHEAELGLRPEQVDRLEALPTAEPDHEAMMTRMQSIHAQMNAAAEGTSFDETAARAAFEEMNAMHTEMGVAMLRNRHAVGQILTAEQREKLAEVGRAGMMGGMHGMMGAMDGAMGGMHGMMEDCPMMESGMMSSPGMMQEG